MKNLSNIGGRGYPPATAGTTASSKKQKASGRINSNRSPCLCRQVYCALGARGSCTTTGVVEATTFAEAVAVPESLVAENV